ncbi:peptidase inhibitor family I36 protein [Kitasatospora sp. NPDC051853]|uniref:peptidase inhibitor family I36 protein n=1 Tax=Kitasatospora sp. NPDC051853 TaxID=3364058 RepID=UPI00378C332D
MRTALLRTGPGVCLLGLVFSVLTGSRATALVPESCRAGYFCVYGGEIQAIRPRSTGVVNLTDKQLADRAESFKLAKPKAGCFTGYERCAQGFVCPFQDEGRRGFMTSAGVPGIARYNGDWDDKAASVFDHTAQHVCFYADADHAVKFPGTANRTFVVLSGDNATLQTPYAGNISSHQQVEGRASADDPPYRDPRPDGRRADRARCRPRGGVCTDPSEVVECTPEYGAPTPAAGALGAADTDDGYEVQVDADGQVHCNEARGGLPVPAGGASCQGIGEGAAWLEANLCDPVMTAPTVSRAVTDTRFGDQLVSPGQPVDPAMYVTPGGDLLP